MGVNRPTLPSIPCSFGKLRTVSLSNRIEGGEE